MMTSLLRMPPTSRLPSRIVASSIMTVAAVFVSAPVAAACDPLNPWLVSGHTSQPDAPRSDCLSPPTHPVHTKLRAPAGLFGAGRSSGTPHQGVDLILNQEALQCLASTAQLPAEAFHVYAVADGRVVYARFNGGCKKEDKNCDPFEKGLGLTVILEHGSGSYSLYAHLAQDIKTNACYPSAVKDRGGTLAVKVGDAVKAGQLIGYMGQLTRMTDSEADKYDGPSGNALRTEQPVQVHFELFNAPAGATDKAVVKKINQISDIVPKAQRGKVNPTKFLESLAIKGYGKAS